MRRTRRPAREPEVDPFYDMLFNMLIAFVFCFIVALLTTMVGLVGNILLGLQLTRLDRFASPSRPCTAPELARRGHRVYGSGAG